MPKYEFIADDLIFVAVMPLEDAEQLLQIFATSDLVTFAMFHEIDTKPKAGSDDTQDA